MSLVSPPLDRERQTSTMQGSLGIEHILLFLLCIWVSVRVVMGLPLLDLRLQQFPSPYKVIPNPHKLALLFCIPPHPQNGGQVCAIPACQHSQHGGAQIIVRSGPTFHGGTQDMQFEDIPTQCDDGIAGLACRLREPSVAKHFLACAKVFDDGSENAGLGGGASAPEFAKCLTLGFRFHIAMAGAK